MRFKYLVVLLIILLVTVGICVYIFRESTELRVPPTYEKALTQQESEVVENQNKSEDQVSTPTAGGSVSATDNEEDEISRSNKSQNEGSNGKVQNDQTIMSENANVIISNMVMLNCIIEKDTDIEVIMDKIGKAMRTAGCKFDSSYEVQDVTIEDKSYTFKLVGREETYVLALEAKTYDCTVMKGD